MDARGKLGEHEKCVRVARGAAESTSSFWVLSKLPKCIHNSICAQLKAWANFFYNRVTARICAKKPFIVIQCKILTTHKKVNKRPYWLVKNTTHFRLWFERELLIQLTDNREWKAKSFRGKWRKSKPNELMNEFPVDQDLKGQYQLKNWAVLRWFPPYFWEKETALQLNRTEILKPGKKKKSSRHLIYARACVNKDFVHSGSVGLV